MNFLSWILLILVLAFSSYVIYEGFVSSSKSGCSSCSLANKDGCSCSKSK